MTEFALSKAFIEKYKDAKPPFKFNGLGELVYYRTYSRIKDDGSNEQWFETVERVVNGTYNMQKEWIEFNDLEWNAWKAQRSAQEMYDKIFNMKFLPPGRGLWAMGAPVTKEKKLYASLNNCAFYSTESIDKEYTKPFCFLMDMSMLGVGVGFDVRGEGKIIIKGPDKSRNQEFFDIPDDREGWVKSLQLLLESYFHNTGPIKFGYDLIRPAGEPIKGFGGVSSGPEPLREMHEKIRQVLNKNIDEPISVTTIVDIMNLIGTCVVAGNVRRTAEIVFGDPNSEEYLDLKNYKKNPKRSEYGWTSNNSIFAELGMNYSNAANRTRLNGEPGYEWLENAQKYSRMCDPIDYKDSEARGGNPCLEQTLFSGELCCLVETFPDNHSSLDEYKQTLKYAYLYAKTVTLGKTHWAETNRVMLRNRRIGCSMSGIAQFITHKGLHALKEWCNQGYDHLKRLDEEYSNWFAIPKSIKMTSIKPSGSVSLLAGATPGVHYPESRFYIRRMRLSKYSNLIEPLQTAGYNIEACVGSEDSTVVVEIPIDIGEGIKTLKDVSIWEQLSLAAFMQKYWADNQVSCTVSFDPKKEGHQIEPALEYFQYQLKGISFLPRTKNVYPQMPYEEISEQEYIERASKITALEFSNIQNEEANVERFCDGESCELVGAK